MGRQGKSLIWWLLGLAAIIFAFAAQGHYARFPRGWLTDDAYFYPQIARHIARSGFSSFDGIHPTDGYHLAWGWTLSAVSWAAGRVSWDSSWQLGVMVSFYLLLSLAMGRLFGENLGHGLWLASTGIVFKMMMETTLLAFVLLILVRHRFLDESGKPAARWTGPLLATVPLIRIDGVIIGGVCCLGQWWRDRDWRALAGGLGWLSAGLLAQLAIMKILFGHWLSVSAEVKASTLSWAAVWSNVQANLSGNYLANLLSWLIALAFWGVAALGLGFPESRKDWSRQFVLAAPLVFVLFHLASNNTLRYWYFVPLLALSVWTCARYPARRVLSRRLAHAVFAAAVVAFAAKSAVDSVIRREQIRWSAEFVERVRAVVGPETPVFQIDASGYVGWWSQLPIVNGDGLVNTHTFAERLGGNSLAGYLEEEGIRLIISNQYPEGGLVVDQGGLKVALDSVETVIPQPEGFPPRTAFVLYRLRQ